MLRNDVQEIVPFCVADTLKSSRSLGSGQTSRAGPGPCKRGAMCYRPCFNATGVCRTTATQAARLGADCNVLSDAGGAAGFGTHYCARGCRARLCRRSRWIGVLAPLQRSGRLPDRFSATRLSVPLRADHGASAPCRNSRQRWSCVAGSASRSSHTLPPGLSLLSASGGRAGHVSLALGHLRALCIATRARRLDRRLTA